ncbi:MAG: Ig-like domain-containing protein [Clostridia bacterium]|nr:Ig-like domain-containing protein [Clostridia bacterium]
MIYDFDEIMEKNSLWLLTHLYDDFYTLRPIHKPNFALDYTSTNVDIYNIGINYSYSLTSTQWKISEASNGASYIIQNNGLSSRTLALDSSNDNVYTASEYSGSPYERWGLEKLSDSETALLEGIIVYGDSAVKIGNSTQLVAGVFSTTTLNQAVTYSSSYISATVTSAGYVTGVSEGQVIIGVTSTADSTVSGVAKVSVVSNFRQNATLIGIPSSLDGTHDHTSYFSDVSSYIRLLYGISAKISTYTNITAAEYAVGYIANSDMTIYRGHGKANYIIFGDDELYSPTMNKNNISGGEMRIFSNSDLILYCCCLCGEGGATGDNLVVATYNEGAKNVIGFKIAIYCDQANEWVKDFLSRLSWYDEITSTNVNSVLLAMASTYSGQTVAHGNILYLYQ